MSSVDLDPVAVLAAEGTGVLAQRRGEVEAMGRLLGWCDLHSVDPATQPGAAPAGLGAGLGGDRLRRIGGEGTPEVSELCFAEFAIAARAGVIATTNRAADFLDLRHRLPNVHDAVTALRLEVWVARKVAAMSRRLGADRVWVVDIAVAEAADESPSRILAIAEAKVIEADLVAHRARIAAEEASHGVWIRRKRPGQRVELAGEADVQGVGMRLSTAGAAHLDETLTAIAQTLADQHVPADEDDVPTMDQFRARAAELLADPHAAARLLDGPPDTDQPDQPDQPDRPEPEAPAKPRKRRRSPAKIVVHLDARVLAGVLDGVARVEGIGPLVLEQLAALLGHREITVQPVIDLTIGRAVNGYEHPTSCKDRTTWRTTRDVFPHSTRLGTGRLDHDHPTPYDTHGPPGQTGDHNDAPLARREHRAKTHLGYRVRQLGLGAYRWETPHGLARLVTGHGTRTIQTLHTPDGHTIGELYDSPVLLACAV